MVVSHVDLLDMKMHDEDIIELGPWFSAVI